MGYTPVIPVPKRPGLSSRAAWITNGDLVSKRRYQDMDKEKRTNRIRLDLI